MADFKLPPYILQELPDITESIHFPIKNIQRIKVSIVQSYLALIQKYSSAFRA